MEPGASTRRSIRQPELLADAAGRHTVTVAARFQRPRYARNFRFGERAPLWPLLRLQHHEDILSALVAHRIEEVMELALCV